MNDLDPQAVNLAKSIKRAETGTSTDAYNAKGASGEFGAYQFMPDTYKAYAKKYVGDENAAPTVENQNKIAYSFVKEKKDAGYNPAQIASMWNAGEGQPDAYKTGLKGVNSKGVQYDVPAYASKVSQYYKEFSGSAPDGTPTQQPVVAQEPKEEKSLARKAVEFAFPILEKKERTPKQVAGDVGLSALWLVPGAGTAASSALRVAGMGAKAAKTAGLVGTGAATGYAADVASKLSANKEIEEALKPGVGTAVGAGTAGLLGRFANKFSEKGVLESVAKANEEVLGQTKRGATKLADSFSRGKDAPTFLAERGINIKNMVDPETLGYATKEASDELRKQSLNTSKILTNALTKVKGVADVGQIESKIISKVSKNHPEQADIIRREMELFRKQYGDTPSVADVNEWKQRNWDLSKFDTAVPDDTRKAHRLIGTVLRDEVEKMAKAGGLKNVDKMNDFIGSHLDAAEMLEKLHGTKAKGGRLGNLMLQESLRTMGGVGGFFGGGPLGALAGGIAGHYGANVLSTLIRKIEGSPVQSAILERMEREVPEVVRQFQSFARKTPKELEALKAQLSEQGIDILKPKNITPPTVLKPKETGNSLIPGLITTGASRAGAQ